MAISEAFAINAVSVSTTELSIVSGTTTLQNNTTAGGYMLFLDGIAAAMAKGDEFIIRIYEKTTASATKRVVFRATIADVQSELFVTPMLLLQHGWDMTIQKSAGTDRSFTASIRKVA
jgi:hypothetical protein